MGARSKTTRLKQMQTSSPSFVSHFFEQIIKIGMPGSNYEREVSLAQKGAPAPVAVMQQPGQLFLSAGNPTPKFSYVNQIRFDQ
jgi:hypothetical protein